MPWAVFIAVSTTQGTTEPVGSVMVPEMVPVVPAHTAVCQATRAPVKINALPTMFNPVLSSRFPHGTREGQTAESLHSAMSVRDRILPDAALAPGGAALTHLNR